MALEAFDAAKDVSLEKPITRTIAEGRALSEASKRLGRIFRVDSELRSAPSVHRAAEIVRNGRIGRVKAVKVGVPGSDVGCPPQPEMPVPDGLDYERWQGPAPRAPYTLHRVHPVKSYDRPGWMRHLWYCDGMIANWGTHLLDGAMWCLDLDGTGPVEIEGKGKYPPPETFWNVLTEFAVTYRFSDGLVCTYRTEKPYFRIEGEDGWVEASFDFLKADPASLLEWKVPPGGWTVARKSDKQDFIDGVRSRKPTLEPAEVGHRVTSLCHLGHIAIQVGERLTWDPLKEIFAGNERANELIGKPIREPRKA
jgi:predicted dehydrogenase